VSKADLRKGPGHYPGSSFPGQAGNAAIAGHRTTYGAPFNRIDELVPGDKITVLTMQGKFTYEVLPSPEARHRGEKNDNWGDGWFAVDPSDVTVLEPSTENLLTLTACHPKYSAKLRIIVQAKLVAEPAAAAETTTTTTTTPVAGTTAKPQQDDLIAGDPKEKTPAITFGALFVGLWLVALILAAMVRRRTEKRLRPWLVYLVFTAPCLFLLWNCFVHLDRFLPSY
jgi:sortase A